jgi:choline dehydrogenase-like flavoprotein
MLPYLCRSETYQEQEPDLRLHGTDGPMLLSLPSTARQLHYPLRNNVLAAWQSMNPCLKWISDVDCGFPLGIGEAPTTFLKNGERQFPHQAYNLDGVEVRTGSLVHKALLQNQHSTGKLVATGVQLINGQQISATREVIISSGAYNSPKLLLLSGIGPQSELQKHGIDVQLVSPHVGRGFRDDMNVRQFWTVRNRREDWRWAHPR